MFVNIVITFAMVRTFQTIVRTDTCMFKEFKGFNNIRYNPNYLG